MTDDEIMLIVVTVIFPLIAWFWHWYTYTGFNMLMRRVIKMEWVHSEYDFRKGYWRSIDTDADKKDCTDADKKD
jgi:hypothetical protein